MVVKTAAVVLFLVCAGLSLAVARPSNAKDLAKLDAILSDGMSQCANPFQLTIPIPFVFTLEISVCSVTASSCGSVKVKAGEIANIDVGVCPQGSSKITFHPLFFLLPCPSINSL